MNWDRLFLIVCAIIVLISITVIWNKSPQPQMIESITGHQKHEALKLVTRTASKGKAYINPRSCHFAELLGGLGIITDLAAAYWIKDDHVFAVNGLAKARSPDINWAPDGVDYVTLKEAIDDPS